MRAPTIIGAVTAEHRERCSTIIRSARRRLERDDPRRGGRHE